MAARPCWYRSWASDSSSPSGCGSSSSHDSCTRECGDPGAGAAVSKRIIVNVGVSETRLAVQDQNLLTELYVERARRRSIVGNIYKGVVTNVLPGMQAAFVDIGLNKDAFLYAGDYTASLGADETIPELPGAEDDGEDADVLEADAEARREAEAPPIEEMLHRGQAIPVQVAKESLGSKGARI